MSCKNDKKRKKLVFSRAHLRTFVVAGSAQRKRREIRKEREREKESTATNLLLALFCPPIQSLDNRRQMAYKDGS